MSCQTDRFVERAVVDSLEFARAGGVLAGSVGVAALSRLADVVISDAGVLVCELHGSKDGEGKLTLGLKVSGTLQLRCQRCLASVVFKVDIDSVLLLVAPGERWPDEELEDDGLDAIEANRELAVLSLIEDEVLLALPVVPRHEDCRPPGASGADEVEHRSSPFAVLAKLKDH